MTAPAIDVDLLAAFPTLTPQQLRILRSPARYRFFLAGRGAGKSWALTFAVLLFALANPRVHGCIGGRSQKDNEEVLLPELYAHLARLEEVTGISWIAKTNKKSSWIKLINGATIHWRGYDRRGKWRGPNLGWAVVDEICWTERAEMEIWEEINPTVRVKCPRPGFMFASSPNGYRGLVKMFADQQAQNNPDYFVVRATSYDNPNVDQSFIDNQIRTMSRARVAQEIYGVALRPSNVVFPCFSERRHVVEFMRPDAPKWILCCDWGINHASALMVCVDDAGTWTVVDEVSTEPGSYVAMHQPIEQMVARWLGPSGAPALIVGDRAVQSEQRWAEQRFGPLGAEVGSIRDKNDQRIRGGINLMVDKLDPAVGRPQLLFASTLDRVVRSKTASIIPAMLGYRWVLDRDGTPIDKPKKDDIHDHAIDAIRYGIVYTRERPEWHGGQSLREPR